MKKLLPYIITAFALAFAVLVGVGLNFDHLDASKAASIVADSAATTVAKIAVLGLLAFHVMHTLTPTLGMAQIDTTLVSNQIQARYSKKLLGKAVEELRLLDFAQQEELPPGEGNTSIRFYRPNAASLSATGAPATLTEGTAPTAFREVTYTAVDIALAQIGEVAKVTDIANNVGLVKYLDGAMTLMGEDMALKIDTDIRNKLVHASTGFTKRYAQGLANFAALSPATLANGIPIPRDLLDARTRLVLNRAPKINGTYVAIMPPEATRDIMNNSEWREVIRQNYADKVFKAEVGDLFGLRIIEGTNPFKEDETEGTEAATFSSGGTNTTGFIYSTIVTGKGGYGTVNMAKAGSSLSKPKVIIVDKPDSGNPLEQYIIVGWKAYWAAAVLNANWGITLRHKTQFVA